MKRTVRFLPLPIITLVASSVFANTLPNFDAATTAPAVTRSAQPSDTAIGNIASVDPQRGTPTFVWVAPPPDAAFASRIMTADPETIAREHIEQNLMVYGLSPAALDSMYVRHTHDIGRGGVTVVFAQRVDGVDVHQTEMKVLIDPQGDVIAVGGNLHPDAISAAARGKELLFSVRNDQAVAKAFADLTGIKIDATNLVDTKLQKDGYSYFDLAGNAATNKEELRFTNPARVKKVFYAMPDRIVPGYYLEIDLGKTTSTSSDLWGYVISAETGELLQRTHLTLDAAFNYKVWAETAAPFTPLDGPQSDWTPHPTGIPDTSMPPFTTPNMVTVESFKSLPGAIDPWLPAAATVTTGNNVDAYADLTAPDGFNGADVRANTTSANTFDYTYDVTLAPNASANQRKASVTELFFMNNWLHDYMYDSGFNEAAGNAQTNNFGRGGAQNDPLLAEGQDNSGTDNANMSTPADGQSPRMQMYVFTGATKSKLIVQPLGLTFNTGTAAFGMPAPFSVTGQLALANDNTGPDVNDACEAVSNTVAGKVALVNRGTCTFESKALRVQQAGAIGMVLANNTTGSAPGMADDANTNGVTIPSLSISQTDGDTLKTAMQSQTLTVTLQSDPQKVNRDGTLDNQIIAHEWGHYFHMRLVTCTTQQCGGESEGWGDFNAALMTLRAGDNMDTGTFAMAIYASDAFGDAGYFGIRRYPYSRDFNKNPLTFKHVTNGVVLPAGPPQNSASPDNWEVHNSGEVWAQMLWQAYTELQLNGGHTFAESKRRMADYITGGMKLAPANPTFTQQRDGILATAKAADLNDAVLLATGFAARGAGTCAVSPPSASTTGAGVVEDFDNAGVLNITGATISEVTACDNDGVVDTDEVGKVNVTVFNSGIGYLPNTTVQVTSATPGVTFPNGNTVTISNINPGATAVGSVNVALAAGTTAITDADFSITVTNPIACTTTVNSTFSARMNYDTVLNSSTTENVESAQAPWTPWGNAGYQSLAPTLWSRVKEAATSNYRFNGKDYNATSDTALESPDLVVGPGPLTITFAHAFDFDYSTGPLRYWDGGVVEYTSNGGATWADVSTLGAAPGYNQTFTAGSTNPLAGRQGYARRNAAWPATNNVTLNMGTSLAGKTVRIRFRLGTDASQHIAAQGWFIDNIAVTGITNQPFHTITQDPLGCNVLGCNANPSSCNDNNPCTDDVCNAGTGVCSNTPKANGASCSDGNACTQTDTCQAGVCTGGNAVVCAALDQCHDVGTCDTATGMCSNPNKANGTACNDSNACTQTDTCQAGTCSGGNPVVCAALDQCHDVGTCNTSTGMCSNPNKANGSACNDGNGCTTGDTCNAGSCTAGAPVVCTALDQCHDVGTCNPGTGACSNPTKADGATCNDGNACTTADSCSAGSCTGGSPLSCNDNNGCTDDSCNPASGCVFTDNTAPCDDGNACTQTDACQGGSCVAGSPVVCGPAPDACHSAGVCNTSSGVCDYTLIGNDGDGDTVGDACDNCPAISNVGQADVDTDTRGDACDNCPADANAGQEDLDTDGQGDACDADIDGDGIANTVETSIGTDPMSKDSDGDNIDDCTEACSKNDGSCLSNGVCNIETPADTDGDTTIDPLDNDSDDDGKTDTSEAGDTDISTKPVDSDGDGVPDYRDVMDGGGTGGMGGMGAGGMGGMAAGGMGGTAGMGGMGGLGGAGGTAGMGGIGGAGGTAGMGGIGGAAGAGGIEGTGGASTGGSTEPEITGGCDCTTPASGGGSAAGSGLLAALGALVMRLRRRRS